MESATLVIAHNVRKVGTIAQDRVVCDNIVRLLSSRICGVKEDICQHCITFTLPWKARVIMAHLAAICIA